MRRERPAPEPTRLARTLLISWCKAGDLCELGRTLSGFLEEAGWAQETSPRSSAACVSPWGSALGCPMVIGPVPVGVGALYNWLRMSQPWVHSAAPRDQHPVGAFGMDSL